MLFSEPKIPQSTRAITSSFSSSRFQCSSASRKFLNRASATTSKRSIWVSVLFSEPKIPQFWLNHAQPIKTASVSVLFSEPKIPQFRPVEGDDLVVVVAFQCSSASRKFLNRSHCSNRDRSASVVSVLFSEPKIPQSRRRFPKRSPDACVSVLFSEPKIPQSA